jgi:urease accessory protein
MMCFRVPLMLVTFLVWAYRPGRADAHLVNSGLGPFYDGLAHLFVTPEDLLVTLALALLAGLRGRSFGRVVLFVLPAAWLAGTFAGRSGALSGGFPALSAGLVALGMLVAVDRRLPLPFVAGSALICGLLNGCFNGAAVAGAGLVGLAAVGIGCAVFVVVAIVAGQVAALRAPWTRIAVRVAGSWIAAIGLLMFGWAMR